MLVAARDRVDGAERRLATGPTASPAAPTPQSVRADEASSCGRSAARGAPPARWRWPTPRRPGRRAVASAGPRRSTPRQRHLDGLAARARRSTPPACSPGAGRSPRSERGASCARPTTSPPATRIVTQFALGRLASTVGEPGSPRTIRTPVNAQPTPTLAPLPPATPRRSPSSSGSCASSRPATSMSTRLADRVARATELIALCRERIGAARLRIDQVIADLDRPDGLRHRPPAAERGRSVWTSTAWAHGDAAVWERWPPLSPRPRRPIGLVACSDGAGDGGQRPDAAAHRDHGHGGGDRGVDDDAAASTTRCSAATRSPRSPAPSVCPCRRSWCSTP